MKVKTGETVCLLGNNGSGKTTLINLVVGFKRPTAGEAFVDGQSVIQNVLKVREDLRLCQQFDFLWEDLTPMEHLRFVETMRNSHNEEQMFKILKNLGLSKEILHAPVSQLSGGNRRQLSIAMTLIGQAKLIILDEPTANLDIVARNMVWNYIHSIKAERAILVTTQNIEEAEYLADRIVILRNGALFREGKPAEIREQLCYNFKMTLSVAAYLTQSMKQTTFVRNDEDLDVFDLVRSMAKERMVDIQEDPFSYSGGDRITFNFRLNHFSELKGFVSDLLLQHPQFQIEVTSNKLEQAYLDLFAGRDSFKMVPLAKVNSAIQHNATHTAMNSIIIDSNPNYKNSMQLNELPSIKKEDVKMSQWEAFKVLLRLNNKIDYVANIRQLILLLFFLIALVPIYAVSFSNFDINHDNLLLGLLSGLMLNQQLNNEQTTKRHLMRLLGVSNFTYFSAFFVCHILLFFMFAVYIVLRVQTWSNADYDKNVYCLSRFVIGFSVIPMVYLLGHMLKRLKNAEIYTVLILYIVCWLIYNVYHVWMKDIIATLQD